jgi:hypothetical protein
MAMAQPQVRSDEKMKQLGRMKGPANENIADAFMNRLDPHTYRYISKSDEPVSTPTGGRFLGVLAQDVEKTPEIGRQIVRDTPRGKVLEGGAMMSAMAGGLGRLNQRVRQLEGSLRR